MIELKKDKYIDIENNKKIDSIFYDKKEKEVNIFIIDIESKNPQKTIKIRKEKEDVLIDNLNNKHTINSNSVVSNYLSKIGVKDINKIKNILNEEEFLYLEIKQESYECKLIEAGWSRKEEYIAFEFENEENKIDQIRLYNNRQASIELRSNLWQSLTQENITEKEAFDILEMRGTDTVEVKKLYNEEYPDKSITNILKNIILKENKKTKRNKLK